MHSKLQEELESTERALEPEFSRLRVSYEQESADLELQLGADERRAKDDLRKLFEEKLAAEERLCKEAQRGNARSRMDSVLRETEGMEKEHKARVERLTVELTTELEKYKTYLATKVTMPGCLAPTDSPPARSPKPIPSQYLLTQSLFCMFFLSAAANGCGGVRGRVG
jgi:hypothetical protein